MKKLPMHIFSVILATTMLYFCGCNRENARRAEEQATKSFLSGDLSQTLNDAKLWAAEDPRNPVPHALMNIAYTGLQNRPGLKAELKLAYGSNDRINRVAGWAAGLVVANPNNPRAYELKGLVAEIADDNQSAIEAYHKAMEVDPSYAQGFESLGNLYLATSQPDKALVVYFRLLNENTNCTAVACDHIATVYVMKKNMPRAIEYFEKSVKLDPNDLVGQYNLAGAYLETDANEKAIAAFQKVVELDPNGEVGQDARRKLAYLQR